jgi:hypothetical protein
MMNRYLSQLESFVRRRGVVLPRVYLLTVLAVLGTLLGFLCLPYCREILATVVLHDWFVVCAITIIGPLFLCDPSRARNPFWAAFHLLCLAGASVLALFFLLFCDLAYRDDRAFLSLLACFASVIAGRAYVADLVITAIARTFAATPSGREHLLSAYARMLDVDPSRAKLRPPALSARLVLSVRERVQRILGLRRTRSRAIEEEVSRAADRQAAEVQSRPTVENIERYVSTMAHEVALHRILVSPGVGSRDVAERWPDDFINRWAVLIRAFQRSSSRVRGDLGTDGARDFRAKLIVPLLEDSRDIMLIVHRDDPGGDKEMQAAIALFRPQARVSTRDLRLEFDRYVLGFRRTAAIRKKTQFAFMLVAQATAEHLPHDFMSVYGSEKSGTDEWEKTGLRLPHHAICLAIACRCQLESGGLSSAQKGPVVARLLLASAQAGFSSDDYPESAWGAVMQSAPLQWQNFAKGTKAHPLARLAALSDDVEPGVGRISITNAFASAVLSLTALFLLLSSPFWLPRKKPFNDLFGPYARANAKARSVDLSSEGTHVAVATGDQGLLSIDVRNYSVGRIGMPDGLSSNELTDVVAFENGTFAVSTEGLYGGKGLDFIRDGKGSPIIGLPDTDYSALTAEPPLTMVNVGGDALFVFSRGLLYYDSSRRVLVAVPGCPSEIITACGSKHVEGRAWILHVKDKKRSVCEVFRDSTGRFVFNDFAADPSVNPARIFHDGVSLWCLDVERSSVHARQGDRWIMRAGSPPAAKENGGLASADALAISRRSSSAKNDVLWMVKSGKAYARTIPRDPLQADLPMPWVEVAAIGDGYVGEVHAFSVDDVGYLIVPYPDRVDLLSHRDPDSTSARKLLLPKDDTRLRSVDVGSSGVIMATADAARSQVYLIDQRQFVGLALDSARAEWPAPVQSSAFLAPEFKFEDLVGAFKSDSHTYHFDSAGRWLKHDSSLHGLVNSGGELLPLEMNQEILGKTKGLKVCGVSQSGDGSRFLVSSSLGIYELPLSSLGVSGPPIKAIVPVSPLMPGGASIPFGLSDTTSGPEIYFQEPRSDSLPEGSAPLASVWRLGNHLRFDSSWAKQMPGGGSGLIYANSLLRSRLDRPDGGTSYGPPVALNEDRRLVFRDLSDDVWRLSGLTGQWSSIVNAPEGGTVIRQRAGEKHDGDVMRISQLLPSSEGLQERRLWSPVASTPKGALLSSDAVVPVYGRGFVFPTDESFWAYQPQARKWEKLMDRAPGDVSSYRVLSDEIRDASGASTIAWWADDTHNIYAASLDKAVIFGRVGALAGGAASGTAYMTVNDVNALYTFNLADGSTRRLFAPIKPDGARSEVGSIEDSEAGVAFLPVGGGKVLALDEDDRFVQADGPSFSAITKLDSRLVGIAEIKGESRLATVFTASPGVGKALNALHGLGGMAVMSSTSGDMWMGGFSGGVLQARIIGDSRASEKPASKAKVVAAAAHAGQLFLSVDGGIHHRPDTPGADERPGFNRIAWSGADWFRSVGGLGKVAPAGGLGCFSLSGKLEFSLITKDADAGFRITNGLDIPVFGPGGGVFRLSSAGKVSPYDGAEGVVYGGASRLGSRSRVHPLDAGLLLLSRTNGAGIAFYDPSTGTDSLLGFVTSDDGKSRGCPFGSDVDFMYASDSPADLPFIRDGRALGRLSSTHGNVEVISEQAESPLILAGRLRWLEGNQLLGAGPLGATAVTKEELPSFSSSQKGVVTGMLHADSAEKIALILDGALVEVDLRKDKFVRHGLADVLFALPNGVVTAADRGGDTWVLADGTAALPPAVKDLGPVRLATSSEYLSVYKNDSAGRRFWTKGVSYSGANEGIDYSLKVAPGKDLRLASGSTILQGRSLVHVEHEKVYRYDLDRGEWTEPGLPVAFIASSFRLSKDGHITVVDERNGDFVRLGSSGIPEADVRRGAAAGVSIDGSLVGVKSGPTGKVGLRAGGKGIESEMDGWPRLDLVFTERSLTYSSSAGATLFFAAEDSKTAKLFVRKGGRFIESEVSFPKPVSDLKILDKPDGFSVTDDASFSQGVFISADGDVSMSFADYDYSPPGRSLTRDRTPRGWVKVAGVYYHSSGYASGRAPVVDVPVRIIDERLMVDVRRVSFDGTSEETVAIPVDCPKTPEMSLVHPDYRKLSPSESAPFVQDAIFADFNGQKVRLLSKSVSSDSAAEVDSVRQLAVLGPTTLVYLDLQGGMWRRDLISGVRSLVAKVSKDARFVYHKPAATGVVSIALEESGRRRVLGADALPSSSSSAEGEVATSLDRFSLTIDRLNARHGQGGFSLVLASRFPLSVSAEGWIVEGASPLPQLRATSEGSLLLEFRSAKVSSAAVLRVPAEGERRMLRADLSTGLTFLADPSVKAARSGGYAFDWSTGNLIVRHDGVSRPLAFAPGGGIESDHHAQVTALHEDGRHYFVSISSVTGRLFARSWEADRLGSLSEVVLSGSTVRPDMTVAVDGVAYVRAGVDWYALVLNDGTISATRLTESPLRKWGEIGKESGALWAFEKGNILVSTESGWEEVPCRSDPVALACDLPSPLFEDYRALPSGRIVFKSRMSDGSKPIWYAYGLDGGVPRRHETTLPAKYVPADALPRQDSLGNPMVFSRSRTASYMLGLGATPDQMIGLSAQAGTRLPHLGEFANAKPAGGAVYFQAGKTVSKAQIYLRVPDDGSKPLLTLSPPAAGGAVRPDGPAEWWLKDGRVSVSWDPSKGLIIGMRGPDGVRSYAKVGSYASGKPFDIDDASQVCLRSARSKSFSFSAHSSLETVMVMPTEGYESLASILSIYTLPEASFTGDVFISPAVFLAEEMRPVDRDTGDFIQGMFSCSLTPEGRMEVRPGFFIPLHRSEQLEGWIPPQGEAVAALRLSDGGLLVQSCGGAWISLYAPSGDLLSGRYVDSSEQVRLRWADPARVEIALAESGSAQLLNLPALTDGKSLDPVELYAVEGGLSLARRGAGLFEFNLEGMQMKPGVYPSVDFTEVSLYGDEVTLADAYGVRTLESNVFSKVLSGGVKRMNFDEITGSGPPVQAYACGAWNVIRRDGKFGITKGSESVLDSNGAPFIDSIEGFDGYDKHLMFVHQERVVVTGSSRVTDAIRWGDGQGMVERASCRDIRLAVSDDASRNVVDFGRRDAYVYDIEARSMIAGVASRRPAGVLSGTSIEFLANQEGAFEMRIALREGDVGPSVVRYVGSDVIAFNQLASDRVLAMKAQGGTFSVLHAPSVDNPAGWYEKIARKGSLRLAPCRDREGPCERIEVPGSYLRPWSETRTWGMGDGKVFWEEMGLRWGD